MVSQGSQVRIVPPGSFSLELLSSPAVYRLGDGIGVRHHAGAQQQGLKSPDYQEQAARITGSLDSSCVETD